MKTYGNSINGITYNWENRINFYNLKFNVRH